MGDSFVTYTTDRRVVASTHFSFFPSSLKIESNYADENFLCCCLAGPLPPFLAVASPESGLSLTRLKIMFY